MTSAQCRAARALLDTSLAELAGAAVVPIAAIVDFETGSATPRPSDLAAIKAALERAGVEFIQGGLKLAKPSSRP